MKKVFLAMLILLMSISATGYGRPHRPDRSRERRPTYRKVCVRWDRRGRCIRFEHRRTPYHRHNDSRPSRFR